MADRLLAAGVLVASALLAWLAVTWVLAARLLQLAIGLSVVYVGYLAFRGWQLIRRSVSAAPAEPEPVSELPFVSVVVPARDEAPVIAGVIRDLVGQRYGSDEPMFEVVLVDDGSSDGTAAIATAAAASAEGRREVFRVLHGSGSGPLPTKGAALAAASLGLRGEIEAALDADTRIGPDFLSGVMAAWRRDPTAAAIQARRRPTNADRSWLTAAQGEEQLMDLASQCGRRQADGTAELRGNGMFVRRDVLRRVGGWSTSAITEDLDLSTRLAAAGEHVALAPEVELGEEAVEGLAALWYQRMRWAEGSLRRLMEHGPGLLAGSAPLGRKADFLAFTTEFLIPPLFVTSIAAALLTIPLPGEAEWTVPISLFLGYGAGTFVLALAGLAGVGVGGWSLVGRATRGSLFLSHWLLVVPAALLWIVFAAPTRRFRKTPRAGHPPDAGDTPGWAVTRPPHGGDGAP